MVIEVKTKEWEKELTGNIRLIARVLNNKGYDLKALDRAGQECRDFITKKVKELGIKDRNDNVNLENLIVMIMMQTACHDMNRAIEHMASLRGVDEKVILGELVAEVKERIKAIS